MTFQIPFFLDQLFGTLTLIIWFIGLTLGYRHHRWLKKHVIPLLFPTQKSKHHRLASVNPLTMLYIFYFPFITFLLGVTTGYLLKIGLNNGKRLVKLL